MFEYWYSDAANGWIVADIHSGELRATLSSRSAVVAAYPFAVHNREQCDAA